MTNADLFTELSNDELESIAGGKKGKKHRKGRKAKKGKKGGGCGKKGGAAAPPL